MKLRANAKINLFLRVAGIDERGFHVLDSLVFSVDISDTVVINADFQNEIEPAIRLIDEKNNAVAVGKRDTDVEPAIRLVDEKNNAVAVEKRDTDIEPAIRLADVKNNAEKHNSDAESRVSLKMSKPICGKNNALAAAEKLSEKYGLPKVDISIEKRIPIAAGLGGSSADTAAVIFGFGKLFGIPAKDCLEFGDDVPFMLSGGAAAYESGADLLLEKREIFIGALKKYTFLVAKPFGEMLTGEVFRVYDERKKMNTDREIPTERVFKVYDGIKKIEFNEAAITLRKGKKAADISRLFCVTKKSNGDKKILTEKLNDGGADISKLIDGIISGDKDSIRENLSNDLYSAAAAISPDLERVRGEIIEAGAFACVMTGSGNAFVGLFEEYAAAERAAKRLKGYEEIILCRAAEKGIVEE